MLILRLFITAMLIISYRLVFAVETVEHVNIKRVMGTWHEIASIPNMWQADCYKNTKSHYTRNDNGTFELKKSCIVRSGNLRQISGVGRVVQIETNAEYKASFIPLVHHLGWFHGKYKMLLIDSDYRYAVVGEDNLEYGWILARKQNIPPRELAEIETKLRQFGYDSCKFMITIQEKGPHHESKPLCEIVKT